jgi:hypothetical protein
MLTQNNSKTLAAAWIAAVLIIALAVGIQSAMGWVLIAVIAIGPALSLLHFAKAPAQTTSERIRDATR